MSYTNQEIYSELMYFPLDGKGTYNEFPVNLKDYNGHIICHNSSSYGPDTLHVSSYDSSGSYISDGSNGLFTNLWIGKNKFVEIYFYKQNSGTPTNQLNSLAFEDGCDFTKVEFCAAYGYKWNSNTDESKPLSLSGDSLVSPWYALPVQITDSIKYPEGVNFIPGTTFAHRYNVTSEDGFRFAAYIPSTLEAFTIKAGDANARNQISIVEDDLADENNILDIYFSTKFIEAQTLPTVTFGDTTGMTNDIKIRFNFYEGYESIIGNFVDSLKETYPDWNIVDPVIIPLKKKSKIDWIIDEAVSEMTLTEALSDSEIDECLDAPILEFLTDYVTDSGAQEPREVPSARISATNGVVGEVTAFLKVTDVNTGEISYIGVNGDGHHAPQGVYITVTRDNNGYIIPDESLGNITDPVEIIYKGDLDEYNNFIPESFTVTFKGGMVTTRDMTCSNAHTK